MNSVRKRSSFKVTKENSRAVARPDWAFPFGFCNCEFKFFPVCFREEGLKLVLMPRRAPGCIYIAAGCPFGQLLSVPK